MSDRHPDQLKANGVFCLYPFVHLSTVPAGYLRPCCYFEDFLGPDDQKKFNVTTDRMEEVWNSPHLRKVRRQMVEGEKVFGCRQCYEEEVTSESSMRYRSFQQWGKDPTVWVDVERAVRADYRVEAAPRFLEIKPGSLCNLKCRMCNQYDSSSVAQEMAQITKKLKEIDVGARSRLIDDHEFSFEAEFDISKMPDWSAHPEIWESIDRMLPTVEMLSFAGGEPTLLEEVHALIRRCVETGHASHIQVFMASNFTKLRPELVEASNHFKKFEFIASIDGTAEIQEYIRAPSRWLDVKRNFEEATRLAVRGRTKTVVNLTLQMYNVLRFTDVLDWIEGCDPEGAVFWEWPYNLNLLFHPRYLSIDYLPPEGRGIALERIEAYRKRSKFFDRFPGLVGRMDLVAFKLKEAPPADYAARLKDFWTYTAILDAHRGHSLEKTEPELHGIIRAELVRLDINPNLAPFGC